MPALLPFRYRVKLRSSAVAMSIGSHSRTTDVCVALRQRRMGGEGSRSPKVRRMLDCSAWNLAAAADSVSALRVTSMSTMLPEEMSGGRRIEGNSIYTDVSYRRQGAAMLQLGAYESFVFCEEHGDTCIDLADGEGDKHGGCGARRRWIMLRMSTFPTFKLPQPHVHRGSRASICHVTPLTLRHLGTTYSRSVCFVCAIPLPPDSL